MHQHLRKIPAMRLVFGQVENDGHGPDDRPLGILGNENESLAAQRAFCRLAPERFGLLARDRQHEADGCAAFHTIDQHVRESGDLAGVETVQPANAYARGHHLLAIRSVAITTMYRADLRVGLRTAVGAFSSTARQSSASSR